MCYWGTWANYRPDGGKFTPEHIDPTLCTHLIYSFAGLETSNWTMKSLDPWMDLDVRKNDVLLLFLNIMCVLGWAEGFQEDNWFKIYASSSKGQFSAPSRTK